LLEQSEQEPDQEVTPGRDRSPEAQQVPARLGHGCSSQKDLTFEASIDGHLRQRGSAVSQENRSLEGQLTVGFWNLPIAR